MRRAEGGLQVCRRQRWQQGELRVCGVPGGRSQWPGERRSGECGGQSRAVHAPKGHMGRETGVEVPGTGRGQGNATLTKESAVSETPTSTAVIFLDICCRNLDLDSKSLTPSGPHETTSKPYTPLSSPIECGYSATHLQGKEFTLSATVHSRLPLQAPLSTGFLSLESPHRV